jgi:Malonate decarboxylase, alpha subunit, transporter/Malonate decarboxylase delta subunit (MdcD)
MDGDANSSTVITGRLAGFGGAPNMGNHPHGRRHSSPAWLDLKTVPSPTARGPKDRGADAGDIHEWRCSCVRRNLRCCPSRQKTGMPLAPIMIYGDYVITTSVNGFRDTWKSVFDEFFSRFDGAASIQINDAGAIPGSGLLRLQRAVEEIEQ